MNAKSFSEMSARIADVIATLDEQDEISNVQVSEYADGSGRLCGLIDTYDPLNELEQRVRVLSPAPLGGPSWTWTFSEWTVEVSGGGGDWFQIEFAAMRER